MLHTRSRRRRRIFPDYRSGRRSSPEISGSSVIPYDYAAAFELKGRPGNIVQDVINVSTEGSFVATAIGYGFEEERSRSISVQVAQQDTAVGLVRPGDITLGDIPALALIEGFRVNPDLDHLIFATQPNGNGGAPKEREFSDREIPIDFISRADGESDALLFQRLHAATEISFLFSIIDSGTGRELQDEPTHNLASLGKSNGERPFRILAQPLTFMPRSTIRLQVIERTEGSRGTLFIVLYGYKMLQAGCPEPLVRMLRGAPACRTETIGHPSAKVIPFDYVANLELTGRSGNLIDDEVNINAEAGFVATAIGYGLEVEESGVSLPPGDGIVDLTLDAGQLSSELGITLREIESGTEIDFNPRPGGAFNGLKLDSGDYEVIIRDEASTSTIRVVNGLTTTAVVELRTSPEPLVRSALVDLSRLPLNSFPPDALADGIRIRPSHVRLAFGNDARPSRRVPANLVNSLFERLNRSADVSFRYLFADSGTGRDLQNRMINNVAGLGIANGDRPFKRLIRPMVFLPRSSIRILVEERFGRGNLFLVFQGYKVLESGRPR